MGLEGGRHRLPLGSSSASIRAPQNALPAPRDAERACPRHSLRAMARSPPRVRPERPGLGNSNMGLGGGAGTFCLLGTPSSHLAHAKTRSPPRVTP